MYVRKSDLNDNIQPGTPISVLTNKWSIGNPIELLPDGNYSKRHDGSLRVGADFYPIKTGYKIICPEGLYIDVIPDVETDIEVYKEHLRVASHSLATNFIIVMLENFPVFLAAGDGPPNIVVMGRMGEGYPYNFYNLDSLGIDVSRDELAPIKD